MFFSPGTSWRHPPPTPLASCLLQHLGVSYDTADTAAVALTHCIHMLLRAWEKCDASEVIPAASLNRYIHIYIHTYGTTVAASPPCSYATVYATAVPRPPSPATYCLSSFPLALFSVCPFASCLMPYALCLTPCEASSGARTVVHGITSYDI